MSEIDSGAQVVTRGMVRRDLLKYAASLAGGSLASGCVGKAAREVVVYTALDEEFSRPLFESFMRETGIAVRAKFDVESTKTVGLTQALLAERARPRCDLFWNNEIVNTLRLDRAGLLAPYRSEVGGAYPPEFRCNAHRWYGFAARARVLLVNSERLDAGAYPQTLEELVRPEWKGRAAVAKPLAGTTATHAACLFATWGPEKARSFWRRLKANVQILGGNKQVAQAVAQGAVECGLTDTDDAIVEMEQARPVKLVFLDQHEGGLGTLFIPNTLALIDGGPNPQAARLLLDSLLRPEVEDQLARGPSAQIPLHPAARETSRALGGQKVRPMQVDFGAAAAAWDEAVRFLRDEFASGMGDVG